jgi:hypothetical protein
MSALVAFFQVRHFRYLFMTHRISLDPPPGLSPEACRNSRGAL